MSQAISTQQPSVGFRSRYQQLRALLAVAIIAVMGLTVAVVLLAAQSDGSRSIRSRVSSSATSTWRAGAARYDGGPEEGTRGALAPSPSANRPYDYNGGHEEGIALR
jgi:hypothetical protein